MRGKKENASVRSNEYVSAKRASNDKCHGGSEGYRTSIPIHGFSSVGIPAFCNFGTTFLLASYDGAHARAGAKILITSMLRSRD